MLTRKRSEIRCTGRLFVVLMAIFVFSGCMGYRKVKMSYRCMPLIENLQSKSLIIGPFYQKSESFQAVPDMLRIVQRKIEKDDVFRSVDYVLDVRLIPNEQVGIDDSVEVLKTTNWKEMYPGRDADVLLVGAVLYEARDRSGYDSEWQVNRYGYRVPGKVYRERLSFSLDIMLIMIDLQTGDKIVEKRFTEDDYVEGAADEVSVFFELSDQKVTEFLDELRGKEVTSRRYLLFH